MCQVNWGGSFSAPWGSKTPELIRLKFGTFHYVYSPTSHAKYGCRRKWGWGGHTGKVVPLHACLHFLVPSAHPQLTLRSMDFHSMHPKMCFHGGCVPLGLVCPGGQIFPVFTLKTIFRLDAWALSVIATATWLGGWLGVCHTPVLYQNG